MPSRCSVTLRRRRPSCLRGSPRNSPVLGLYHHPPSARGGKNWPYGSLVTPMMLIPLTGLTGNLSRYGPRIRRVLGGGVIAVVVRPLRHLGTDPGAWVAAVLVAVQLDLRAHRQHDRPQGRGPGGVARIAELRDDDGRQDAQQDHDDEDFDEGVSPAESAPCRGLAARRPRSPGPARPRFRCSHSRPLPVAAPKTRLGAHSPRRGAAPPAELSTCGAEN